MRALRIGTILSNKGTYPNGALVEAPRGKGRELGADIVPISLNPDYSILIKNRNKRVESLFRTRELKKLSKKKLRELIVLSKKEDIIILLTDLGYIRRS